MTGGNEKTTFNMSAEFYKNQFIERYSFEDAGNFRVASQTNISKRVKFSEILTVGFNNTIPICMGRRIMIMFITAKFLRWCLMIIPTKLVEVGGNIRQVVTTRDLIMWLH